MSLKTATLIALIGVLADSLLWLLQSFGAITMTPSTFGAYAAARVILGNGTLALFLVVLYSKQKQV
jgi:hypothetical protein